MSHLQPIGVLMMVAAFALLATSRGVQAGVFRPYQPDATLPAAAAASQPSAASASGHAQQRPSYFQTNYRMAAAANNPADSGAVKQLQSHQQQSHQQQLQLQQSLAAANNLPPLLRPGISAWGLIALIVFVILIGMAGYYGIMCYPLFCHKDGNYYNTMREASSTSSETPLGVGVGFGDEKLGDYSTRSTTPSKSHE